MKPEDFLDPANFDKITPDMYDELNQQIEDIWRAAATVTAAPARATATRTPIPSSPSSCWP